MKLKPKDIRIGNIIHSPDTDKWVIAEMNHLIYIDNTEGDSLEERIYTAEPLTQEWLLKLGFENSGIPNDNYSKMLKLDWDFSGKYLIIRTLANKVDFSFSVVDADHDQDVEIVDRKFSLMKFVHQLQNLYYALTGEELKVQETSSH